MMDDRLSNVMDCIGRCAELIVIYCDGEERKKHLNNMEELMKTCCSMENKFHAATTSFQDVKTILKEKRQRNNNEEDNDNEESETEEINIQDLMHKKINEKCGNSNNYKKHAKFINYKKSLDQFLKQAENDEDEELAITEAEVNTLDPITKQKMVDPVRIRKCGHTFERNSIMSLLRKRSHIKCPVPGCLQNNVSVKDLEDDRNLKQVLSRLP